VLYFGSEIKCLLAGSGERAVIDPAVVGQVFTFWGPLPGQTVFRGIHELPPGYWMLWHQGEVEFQQYWHSSFDHEKETSSIGAKTVGDLKEELKALLIDATRIRLRADVPVGAYLSGGLDSSLIASVVRQYTSNRLRTFSIAFTDERYDERDFPDPNVRVLGDRA